MEMQTSPDLAFRKLRSFGQWAIGRSKAVPPLILLILALGLALRIYGITWDDGNFFHPDERSIYMRVDCMYQLLTDAPTLTECTRDKPFQQTVPGWPSPMDFLDADKSPLNPHWFPLGTMVIYVLVGFKLLLAPIVTMGLEDLAIVGRTLSALADVGTIFMVYTLGKRLFNQNVGLLAAALVCFSVVHIQISHFYRPETFTNLFTLCSFWFMLNVHEHNRVRDSWLLGVFIGLSFATKLSVLPLLIPVITLYLYTYVKERRNLAPSEGLLIQESLALRVLAASAAAAVTYLFLTPYALLDFPEFFRWNIRELDIIRNAGTVPYTIQYLGTANFIYELRQTIVWGLGIPLGLLAWGGFFAIIVSNVKRPKFSQTLLLLWAVPLLITVCTAEVKFLRYTFPLMPILILMGSAAGFHAIEWVKRYNRHLGNVVKSVFILIVVATILYGLAFTSIYTRAHPAVQASQWINSNILPGSSIVTDNHWDEGIPGLGRYKVEQLPVFEGDTRAKMDSIARKLAAADYLLFYSNRTYGAINRIPERYPYTANYYSSLFNGDLGFKLAQDFNSYPQLFGIALSDDTFERAMLTPLTGLQAPERARWTINQGYADNDVIGYDHPLVLVLENKGQYSPEVLLDVFMKPNTLPSQIEPKPLMLTPIELETQQSGGTWSKIFNPDSFPNRFPVLVWLLLIETAFLATFPIGYLVFRGLHDRGYLLTKILSVLLLAYIPWVLSTLALLPFGRLSIFTGLALLFGVSSAIAFRQRHEIWGFVRTRWRTIALEEGLFLVAFLVFLILRWANPDLWHPFRGGEKPMDLAYLNAIVRSTTGNPYDPWFAGGYLNYYHFGLFIVATMIKVTGILTEIAYNLAIPLLFALTVGGAFSIAYNFSHAVGNHLPQQTKSGWIPTITGFAAVLFIAVLGNMGSAVQLVVNTWNSVTTNISFPSFNFWGPSRMMPDQISINEFPFWSFLFGDLHAHLIAIPFTLLVVGLSLNLVRIGTQREGNEAQDGMSWRSSLLSMGILAFSVGSLAAINTWDYPSYLIFSAAALVLAMYSSLRPNVVSSHTMGQRQFPQGLGDAVPDHVPHSIPGRPFPVWQFMGKILPRVALLIGLSYALFAPYHIHNSGFDVGVHASEFQTNILHYIGINALFIFLIISFLFKEGASPLKSFCSYLCQLVTMRLHSKSAESRTPSNIDSYKKALTILGVLAVIMGYLLASGYITVALLFVLTSAAVSLSVYHVARETTDAPLQLFLLMLLGGGLGLGIAVDLVTVDNDIDRMNTVFKLGLEAWILLGLFSAMVLPQLLRQNHSPNNGLILKGFWLAGLAIVILAAAVFPVLGTRARLADRFDTEHTGLNGAQFLQTATYQDPNGEIDLQWDWDGIQWLRKNVQGSPVIAEGNTDPHNYRWGSRVSVYTGLPTIIGWGWHQTQQRPGQQFAIRSRLNQVKTLFSTDDPGQAWEILKEHRVKYIYVGQLERLYYPPEGLSKFDKMSETGIKLVYTNPQVKIYMVTRET